VDASVNGTRIRVWKSATWGALLGLWTGAWLLAVPLVAEWVTRTWGGMPDLVITRAWVASQITARLGLAFAPILSTFVLLVPACAGIAAVGTFLVQALKLGPGHLARASMAWALRPFIHPSPYWVYFFLAVSLGNVLPYNQLGWWVMVAMLAVVALWMALLPLGILRREVARTATGAGWWAPRWPGLQVVLAALVPWLAVDAIEAAADSATGWLWWSTRPPLWLVDSVAGLASCVALVVGLSLPELWSERHSWLSWQVVGPFLRLVLRLGLLALWAVAPALCCYVLLRKVVPVLATLLQSQGGQLPLTIQATVSILNAIGRFWWLLLPPLWLPYQLLASARLVTLALPEDAGFEP